MSFAQVSGQQMASRVSVVQLTRFETIIKDPGDSWWRSTMGTDEFQKKSLHTAAEQTELKVYSIHSRLQRSTAYCQLQNENRICRIFMFRFMAPHFKLKGAIFNQRNLGRFFCLETSMQPQLVSSNHPNIKWHLGLQICLQTQSQPTELAKLTLDPFENTSCLPL